MAKARGSIQNIYNTLAFMQALNPTLLSGQVAYYKDAVGNKLVVGDGVTPFMSLVPMFGASIIISAAIPLSSVGNNGDIAILTTPGQIAQKTGGAWAVVYTFPSGGGAGTVTAVNTIAPVGGNVTLTADNIPAGATNKYWTKAATDTYYLPLAGGALAGPLVLSADPTAALQAATKAYVDRAVLGAMKFQGAYSAATNLPLLPVPSTANNGFYWILSDAGTQYGFILNAGDWIVSNGQYYEQVNNYAVGNATLQQTATIGNVTNTGLIVTGNASMATPVNSIALRSYTQNGASFLDSITTNSFGAQLYAPFELKSTNINILSDRTLFNTKTSGIDIVGDIIVSQFTAASDFSNTPFAIYTPTTPDGVTFTAGPAGITTISSASNFNNYIAAPYTTLFREWYTELTYVVGAKGVGLALNIGNTTFGIIGQLNTSTGVLTLNLSYGQPYSTAATILPINIGDVLKLRVIRTGLSVTAICLNITQNIQVTCSFSFTEMQNTPFPGTYPANTLISNAGGTYTIQSFYFGSTEKRNSYIAILGDSITDGSFAAQNDQASGVFNDANNSYASILANSLGFGKTITNLSISSTQASNYSSYLPDLGRVNPRYALFALGINDAINANSTLITFQGLVTTFINYCAKNGIIPILTTPIPLSSSYTITQQTLVQSYAAYINSLAPDYYTIDVNTPLLLAGHTYSDPQFISSGNILHPNQLGHLTIAQTILSRFKTFSFQSSGTKLIFGPVLSSFSAAYSSLAIGGPQISGLLIGLYGGNEMVRLTTSTTVGNGGTYSSWYRGASQMGYIGYTTTDALQLINNVGSISINGVIVTPAGALVVNSIAVAPTGSVANGLTYYNTTSNLWQFRQNGVWTGLNTQTLDQTLTNGNTSAQGATFGGLTVTAAAVNGIQFNASSTAGNVITATATAAPGTILRAGYNCILSADPISTITGSAPGLGFVAYSASYGSNAAGKSNLNSSTNGGSLISIFGNGTTTFPKLVFGIVSGSSVALVSEYGKFAANTGNFMLFPPTAAGSDSAQADSADRLQVYGTSYLGGHTSITGTYAGLATLQVSTYVGAAGGGSTCQFGTINPLFINQLVSSQVNEIAANCSVSGTTHTAVSAGFCQVMQFDSGAGILTYYSSSASVGAGSTSIPFVNCWQVDFAGNQIITGALTSKGTFVAVAYCSATYTVPATGIEVIIASGSTAYTITLPSCVAGKIGQRLIIIRAPGSSAAITITAAGSPALEGTTGTYNPTATLGANGAIGSRLTYINQGGGAYALLSSF